MVCYTALNFEYVSVNNQHLVHTAVICIHESNRSIIVFYYNLRTYLVDTGYMDQSYRCYEAYYKTAIIYRCFIYAYKKTLIIYRWVIMPIIEYRSVCYYDYIKTPIIERYVLTHTIRKTNIIDRCVFMPKEDAY